MLQDPLLYNQRPTGRQIQVTAGIAITLLLIFAAAVPFRNIKLWELDSYIPAVESLLMLGDLITAALLLSQASIMRSAALVALGTAYFYSGLALIPHALTFPGAFSPTGLLDARVNSSAWLYLFWRPGLSVGAIAYALLKRHSDWPGTWPSPNRAIALCLAGAALLVVAFTVLSTAGDSLLPSLLSDPMHWRSSTVLHYVLALLVLNFVAIGLIWRRFYSVLDLWLLLILCTVTIELTMTSIIWGRFCLGWYVERTLGLFSGLFVLMMLLTETHRLYRQNMLRASARERERERQLLIRDATAAAIAHELRQPLSAILLNAQIGLKLDRDDEDVYPLLKGIVEDTNRASEIIDSTRSLFGKPSMRTHTSDINQLLRKTLALIGQDLKDRGVEVNLVLDESLPRVAVNRIQIQELFLNLFTNAMEAMYEHASKVRVLTVKSSLCDNGLMIRVQDTGPGIADADLEQIFDPFYTTKKNGTGVGLLLCQTIVATHSGTLRAMHADTTGAAFEICLPVEKTGATGLVKGFKAGVSETPASREEQIPAAAKAEAERLIRAPANQAPRL